METEKTKKSPLEGLIISLNLVKDGYGYPEGSRNRKFPSLIWSPYDRISINRVSKFKDFLDNEISHNWDGFVRNLNLIAVDGFNDRENSSKQTLHEYWCFPKEKETEESAQAPLLRISYEDKAGNRKHLIPLFVSVIALKVNFVPTEKVLKEQFILSVDKLINEQITVAGSGKDPFFWKPYLSIGTSDLVLLAAGNDLNDLAKFSLLLNHMGIKDKEDSSVTIQMANEIISYPLFNAGDTVEVSNPSLLVMFKVKGNLNEGIEKINDWLSSRVPSCDYEIKEFYNSRFDGAIKFNSGITLSDLYSNETGLLNGRSDKYNDIFLRTISHWVNEDETSSFPTYDLILESQFVVAESGKDHLADIYNNGPALIEKWKEQMPRALIVYREMNNLIADQNLRHWRTILKNYRDAFVKSVNEYIRIDLTDRTKSREDVPALIEDSQTVIGQIRQITLSIEDEQQYQLGIPGSFEKVIRFYYLLVKAMLEMGYAASNTPVVGPAFKCDSSDGKEKIPEIGIIITGGNKIFSNIYKSVSENDDGSLSTEKIVVFKLPFSSLTDIKKTVFLLTHETAHYFPPYNRSQRNAAIVQMYTALTLDAIISEFASKVFDDSKPVEIKQISDNLRESIFQKRMGSILKEIDRKNFVDYLPDFGISDIEKNPLIDDQLRKLNAVIVEYFTEKVEEILYREGDSFEWNPLRQKLLTRRWQILSADKKELSERDLIKEFAECSINFTESRKLLVHLAYSFKEACADNQMIKLNQLNVKEYEDLFYTMCFKDDESEIPNLIGEMNLQWISLRLMIAFWLNESRFKKHEHLLSDIKPLVEGYLVTFDSMKEIYEDYFNPYCDEDYLMTNDGLYQCVSQVKKAKDIRDYFNLFNTFYYSDNIGETNFEHPVMKDPINKEIDAVARTQLWSENWPVTNVAEYIQEVIQVKHKISTKPGEELWYRGVCHSDYGLQPSLFRSDMVKNGWSLYSAQIYELKRCYQLLQDKNDVWDKLGKDIPSHVSLLQHYGARSNLLDFTDNPLVSLHFALNPDVVSDQEKLERGEFQPAVYLFDKNRYSKAIELLNNKMKVLDKSKKSYELSKFNFALDEYEGYFPKNLSNELCKEYDCKCDGGMDYEYSEQNYPVPVILRQNNDRILKQRGYFLAYSLESKRYSNEGYDYLNLVNIQNLLKKNIGDPLIFEMYRFLWVIKISKKSVALMKSELKDLGIRSNRYYPEIFNLLKSE